MVVNGLVHACTDFDSSIHLSIDQPHPRTDRRIYDEALSGYKTSKPCEHSNVEMRCCRVHTSAAAVAPLLFASQSVPTALRWWPPWPPSPGGTRQRRRWRRRQNTGVLSDAIAEDFPHLGSFLSGTVVQLAFASVPLGISPPCARSRGKVAYRAVRTTIEETAELSLVKAASCEAYQRSVDWRS